MDNETPDFFKEKDIFGLDKPAIKVDRSPTMLDTVPNDLAVVYATLGARIIAYFLDVAILLIPLFVIEGLIFGPDFASSEYSLRRNLFNLVVWAVYYGLMESSESQATFGKKNCGLIVIDELGNRLTFKKAAFRYLAQIISILPLGFGIWAIAKDEKKQGWHDALVGCYVIKGKPTETNNSTIND